MYASFLRRARAGLATVFLGRQSASVEERNYRNLLFTGAWFGPVDGGIYNFLPVFLARLGASPALVSLLISGPALVGIFAYIPGGAYAERHSDLVRLTVRAGFIARLAYPLIVLLPLLLNSADLSIAAVLIWSLSAIPNAVHISAWISAMQKALPPKRRGQLNGTRWALLSLTAGLAIALFGWLLDRTPFPGGYQLVFLASWIAGLMNLYYIGKVQVSPFVPDWPAATIRPSVGARIRAFGASLTESREFVRYNVANLGYRLVLAMPAGLFSVFWVNERHATDTWIGLRGTAGYAALVVGYWFWGQVANRSGHRRLLLICGVAQAFYPCVTALAPSMQWLLPAAVVWGFSMSGLDIGLFDMLLAACPEGRQPRFAGGANMLASVAITVGPLLGAALAQGLGTRTALFVIAGVQAAGTLFFLLLPGREQEGKA